MSQSINGTGSPANWRPPSWRMSREISYGNILNAVVIAATVIVFVTRQEGRNDVQDVRLSEIEQRLDRDVADIRAALARIEIKLDQKADKP